MSKKFLNISSLPQSIHSKVHKKELKKFLNLSRRQNEELSVPKPLYHVFGLYLNWLLFHWLVLITKHLKPANHVKSE